MYICKYVLILNKKIIFDIKYLCIYVNKYNKIKKIINFYVYT